VAKKEFSAEQVQKYYQARLIGQRLQTTGENWSARCPFHDDKHSSLSINSKNGKWFCHGPCNCGGWLVEFEQKFSSCDQYAAVERIAEVVGDRLYLAFKNEPPTAVYPYRDELGKLLFEKVRYPGKRFLQRQANPNGGYFYHLKEVRRVLYNLPEVLSAREVVICEGEKDCDTWNALGWAPVATCNFDGAGKWLDEYSPYFCGKTAVIFEDNDDAGRKHALHVAQSLSRYARQLKVVRLPGLPEHGDLTDWLKTHTPDELLREVMRTEKWTARKQTMFVSPVEFVEAMPDRIDWMIEDVIQRHDNGFVCADPKGSKSFITMDMCLSLALGKDWMGHHVPRRVKVALVSREDNARTTGLRMRRLCAGKGNTLDQLDGWFYLNSRAQTRALMLDDEQQYSDLMFHLREFQPEFLVLDVMNVLHEGEENDAKDMRHVLAKVTALQQEVGCACAIIHHFRKGSADEAASLTQRLRGSSAIAGWAEWMIGLSLAEKETKIRRMEFESKVAKACEPAYYIIRDLPDGNARVEVVDYKPESQSNLPSKHFSKK
jgi:putative DNA primase/helicase